jgi:ComEC/Rec2-related protein
MRREIEARPLVLFALALVVGLVAVGHPAVFLFLVVGAGVFRDLRSWSALAAGLVLGLWRAPILPSSVREATYVEGVAHVVSIPQELGDLRYCSVDVSGFRVKMRAPETMDVHFGDGWAVKGVVRPLSEIAAGALGPEGIQGTLAVYGGQRVSSGPVVFAWADGVRERFEAFAGSVLPAEEAGWLDRLCFRSGSLSASDQEELNEAGAGYLVAASGLQVYVLAGLVFLGLTGVRLPRPVSLAVVCLVLAGYCLATGAHLTTVRASFACVVFGSAYLFRREPDTLSVLALASSAFLLVSPAAVYSLGFVLTAVVVVALALFLRPGSDLGVLGWVKQAGLAAAIIVLAGQPVVGFYTGRFSAGAIPSNLLMGGVAPVSVGLAFVGFVFSFVSSAVGAGILSFAGSLAEYLRVVVEWVSNWGFSMAVPAFSAWWLVLYYGLWIAAWRPRARMA